MVCENKYEFDHMVLLCKQMTAHPEKTDTCTVKPKSLFWSLFCFIVLHFTTLVAPKLLVMSIHDKLVTCQNNQLC